MSAVKVSFLWLKIFKEHCFIYRWLCGCWLLVAAWSLERRLFTAWSSADFSGWKCSGPIRYENGSLVNSSRIIWLIMFGPIRYLNGSLVILSMFLRLIMFGPIRYENCYFYLGFKVILSRFLCPNIFKID